MLPPVMETGKLIWIVTPGTQEGEGTGRGQGSSWFTDNRGAAGPVE